MSDSSLVAVVRQAIDASHDRRITFADYMELALYHPESGYYSRGAGLGAGGDFATSVHLCADFGEMIALQLLDMWQQLDRPERFDLVEMGAGQGILAGDVLRYLRREAPECFRVVNYRIVEKSRHLRQVQQQQLAALRNQVAIAWCDLEAIAEGAIVGCCVSNELLDAFPVHRVRLCDGRLQEVYVTYDPGAPEVGFVEVTGELSTPALAQYFVEAQIGLGNWEDWGDAGDAQRARRSQRDDQSQDYQSQASANAIAGAIDPTDQRPIYPEGYTTEVNLAAKSWIQTIARVLDRGYVLTIDYGYDSDRYYAPARRDGTLNCYSHHRHHPDPYHNPGQQDITAHVDFGAIERWGRELGLETLGRVPQALFLMALGLGDRLSTLGQPGLAGRFSESATASTASDVAQIFQRYQVLRDLIDPQGLGGFQVLVQAKGDRLVNGRSPVAGLTIPTMP